MLAYVTMAWCHKFMTCYLLKKHCLERVGVSKPVILSLQKFIKCSQVTASALHPNVCMSNTAWPDVQTISSIAIL